MFAGVFEFSNYGIGFGFTQVVRVDPPEHCTTPEKHVEASLARFRQDWKIILGKHQPATTRKAAAKITVDGIPKTARATLGILQQDIT